MLKLQVGDATVSYQKPGYRNVWLKETSKGAKMSTDISRSLA